MSEVRLPAGLDQAAAFQRDLYLYWRDVREAGGIQLTTRGYVARPALRRIRSILALADHADSRRAAPGDVAESDDGYLLYVRRLLERLRLVSVAADGARLIAGEPAETARYLGLPFAQRLRTCARLWVAGAWWNDHHDFGGALPRLLAPAPPRVALARRRTLELLGSHALDEEISIPLAAHGTASTSKRSRVRLRTISPNLLRPARKALDAESETLRAALLGPLAWMGFVVPAEGSGDREPRGCRVTRAVAALAAGADTFADMSAELIEPVGRVVAQPDLSLVAYPPLGAPLLLTLDTCAERIALDVVARYRLTREAASSALTSGWTAREVIARLEALTGASLPANVATTLADWERHHERLRLTPDVTVLLVDDAAKLDALLADRTAREWIERRLTPNAALVVPAHASRTRAWLLRHGELPAWHRASIPAGDVQGMTASD